MNFKSFIVRLAIFLTAGICWTRSKITNFVFHVLLQPFNARDVTHSVTYSRRRL